MLQSVTRKNFFLLLGASLLATVGIGLATNLGLGILSAVRAYVGCEGLWSKSEKRAVINLHRYAENQDEKEFEQYRHELDVPLGDRRAREELEKPDADLDVADRGFLAGGDDPRDVHGMSLLFRWLGRARYFAEAIEIWRKGDREIEKLDDAASRLHRAILGGRTAQPAVQALLAEIDSTDRRLTVLEDRFSSTLGQGARWVRRVLLWSTIISALLIILIGGTLARRVVREAIADEARYLALFDESPLPMWLYDPDDLKFVTVNQAAVNHYGYSREEFGRMTLVDIRPPEAVEQFLRDIRRMPAGDWHPGIYRHGKKDGTLIDVDVHAHEVTLGRRKLRLSVLRDVTEQHLVESAIRVSEKRFRRLFERNLAGVCQTNLNGDILECNETFARILGYESAAELLNRSIRDLYVDPSEREGILTRLKAERVLSNVEIRKRRKDGSLVWVLANLSFVEDPEAEFPIVEGTIIDITERVEAEKESGRLALIVESSEDAIIGATPDAVITSWNRGAEMMYGFSKQEALGRNILMIVPPGEVAAFAAIRETTRKGESIEPYEAVRMRKDGHRINVSVRVFHIRDAQGEIVGSASITRDVTERKRAEEALRESRAFLERAQEVAHIGSWISGIGKDDHLIWSKETHRIFGVAPETFDGKVSAFYSRIHPEDQRIVEWRIRAAVEEGRPFSVEHRIVRPDGTIRWVQERADIERDRDGHPIRMVGTVQDITERRQLQDQLFQSQKIEAIGRLAGGVAHDFNNILTAILGNVELLSAEVGPDSPLLEEIDEIRKSGERAAALTRQLLAFSRRQMLEPRLLNLNELIEGLDQMLHRLLGEDVDLVLSLDPALAQARADPNQLEQVIVNLVVNARDAMPDGGKLTITTSNEELDEAAARLHLSMRPGRYVLLAVNDTGTGMDAATASRIFEPFFTTKEKGKGTGLGLSTVYGIVKQSEGYIWAYTEPGRGTTFKIYLPQAEGVPGPVEIARQAQAAPGGTETILLVEDEAPLRKLARRTLEGLGYKVLEASGGSVALEVAHGHDGPIHLILTDVVMPEMSGTELASQLTTNRPAVRVLFMSGYTDDVVVRHGLLGEKCFFLQKPFSPSKLAEKVREVLAGAA